jgi:Ca2+-binding RTX toxin-like protein
VAQSSDGTTLIGNDADAETLTASTSGNDTLQAGAGNNDVLNGATATGNITFTAGTGNDTMMGGSGNNTYVLSGTGSASDLIVNNDTGTNQSVIEFTAGVSPSQVALSQSGNDLVLTVGTETVTVQNYFAGTGNDINAVQFADGTVWDQNYIAGIVSSSSIFTNGVASLTADQFDSYSSIPGSGTIFATTAGTYDLEGKATSLINLAGFQSAGNVTLIGNDADGEQLTASVSGNDTLQAGNGNNDLLGAAFTTGNNMLIAGSGIADFLTASGSSGSNTLDASSSAGSDDLDVTNSTGNNTLIGGSANYDTLNATGATGNNTFIAGAGNQMIYGGEGNNTYVASAASTAMTFISNDDTGTNNSILELAAGVSPSQVALSYSGDDLVVTVGTETITVVNYFGSTSSEINAIQFADGTVWDQNYIANNAQIFVNGFGFLAANVFDGLNSIPGSGTIFAATAGTYDLVGKSTSLINLVAEATGGTTLIGNDANGETLTASASGNDTLIGGNGNNDVISGINTSGNLTLIGGNGNNDTLFIRGSSGNDTVIAGNGNGDIIRAGLTTGNDTLIAGTGNDTINGGFGYDIYQFGSTFGHDVINTPGGSSANGEIDFTGGITDQNLWFQQSGNNLQIDLLGTNDQITVNNWFSGAGFQVTSIDADGLKIDSQLAQLVSAMATYGANNSGFNPTTATSMPTDATLQSTIAAAWHS